VNGPADRAEPAGAAYGSMAEFYELVAERQVASSGPHLRAALASLDPAAGPVVEIGAGTGRVTELIAQALPGARIVAVEPSAPMRAVLTSRLADRPDLRRRVTVLDAAAPDLPLPDVIGAAVVFGVAGHLDPPLRRRLWHRIAERLAPGGIVAVELMGMRAPRAVPAIRQLRETIGRQTYEWWVGAQPEGEGRLRFTSRWVVLDRDGAPLREVTDSYLWYPLDASRLERESGLRCRALGSGTGSGVPEVVLLSRPPAA
jgi:SAM-dependent methyltransferase